MLLPQNATDRNLLFAALFLTLSGCATSATVRTQQDELNALKKQYGELKTQVGTLGTRVDSMEGKFTALHAPPPVSTPQSTALKPSGIGGHPSDGIGSSPDKIAAAGDPEPGFVNDDAVQDFRKAMILFEAGRYPDSTLAFASFLERFPDHPFAGAAQFYVGKGYLKQNQYSQAYDEFQRVLTTYDRSSHITETLRDLAETEEKLQKTQDAARHRHLLSSLFPQSPAFAAVTPRKTHAPTVEKQVEEIAGEPAPSRKKPEPTIERPKSNTTQLDEPPPPTAPVEKLPKPRPQPKPGDMYPATEDKS